MVFCISEILNLNLEEDWESNNTGSDLQFDDLDLEILYFKLTDIILKKKKNIIFKYMNHYLNIIKKIIKNQDTNYI